MLTSPLCLNKQPPTLTFRDREREREREREQGRDRKRRKEREREGESPLTFSFQLSEQTITSITPTITLLCIHALPGIYSSVLAHTHTKRETHTRTQESPIQAEKITPFL